MNYYSLLKAIRAALKYGSTEYESIICDILRQHIEGTKILSSKRADQLINDFSIECENVRQLLLDLSRRGGVDSTSEDRILSIGERMSTKFMTALLEERGTPAEYVDLSTIITWDAPQGLSQDFYRTLAEVIGRRIQACGSRVPVITGFFGNVPGGILNTCGRGYSDLLAAIVAVGVNAKELQVLTCQEHIFYRQLKGLTNIDPRKVPTATLLESIHPSEANELTFFGSEVIHHFTIEQCIPNIPIRIKNVREPDGSGTLIFSDDKKRLDPYYDQRPRRPTAVTVKHHITVVNVHSHRKVGSPEFLAQICATLAQWSLAVDLFELNECHVSLAVHSKSPFITMVGTKDKEDVQIQHRDLQSAIQELQDFGSVKVIHEMAILSLIGKGLKRSCGMAGRLFSALGDNNINIEMISQGASEINISCVITERDALRALNVVHTELFTFLE
ncbi:MAG: hypothetical protein Q9217_001234 [Psora testacea]